MKLLLQQKKQSLPHHWHQYARVGHDHDRDDCDHDHDAVHHLLRLGQLHRLERLQSLVLQRLGCEVFLYALALDHSGYGCHCDRYGCDCHLQSLHLQ